MVFLNHIAVDKMVTNALLLGASIGFLALLCMSVVVRSIDEKRVAISPMSGGLLFVAIVTVILFWGKTYP